MPKLNENLIRSMVWDLEEIVKVTEDMKSRVGNINCTSWRYPSKRCDSVDVLAILEKDSRPPVEHYINLLEMVYDRLLYLFNLIVTFFDRLPILCDRFTMGRNMLRPGDIPLNVLVHTCWQRLKDVQDVLLQQMVSEMTEEHTQQAPREVLARGSQTDTCSLKTCECCSVAQEFLKTLVHNIQTHAERLGVTSEVAEERKLVKSTVLSVSQWGSIRRWTSAVLSDLEKLVQALDSSLALNKTLRDALDKQVVDYQKASEQSASLKTKEAQLAAISEEKLELELEVTRRDEELAGCREELQTCKRALQKRASHVSELESEREGASRRLEELKGERKDAERVVNRLQEEREKLEQEVGQLREKVARQQELTRQAQEAEKSLAREVTSVTSQYKKTCKLVTRLEGDLKQSTENEALLLAYPDLNGPLQPADRNRGDPIHDMDNQVRANTLRIELLTAQNVKLSTVVVKMKKRASKHSHVGTISKGNTAAEG